MKDKDYEEKSEPIQVPEPIKEIPISSPPKRRESLLLNPTASSKLKDLHTNPLPPRFILYYIIEYINYSIYLIYNSFFILVNLVVMIYLKIDQNLFQDQHLPHV